MIAWGRHRTAASEHAQRHREERVSSRIVMARVESSIDRLEGVYQQLAATLEQLGQQPAPRQPKREGH